MMTDTDQKDGQNMRRDFYVYAWLRSCGAPFYIGKGRGKRDGTRNGRNFLFNRILSEIIDGGGEPRVVRLHEGLSEAEAFSREIELIAHYGRIGVQNGVLANLTDGGEGISGLAVTDEVKTKILNAKIAEGVRPNNTSGFKGVSFHKVSGKYTANINIGGKRKNLGLYDTAEDAAKVYDYEAFAAWGEAANLNIPTAMGDPLPDKYRRADIISKSMRYSGPRKDNVSGFKGVRFCRRNGMWEAGIRVDGTRRFLGYHSRPEDAARAYDDAAFYAWGLRCFLNFRHEWVNYDKADNDNKRQESSAVDIEVGETNRQAS